ncbi:MAG: GntR family transcriptional regulator [Aminobacterium sp.]|jgi:DNA-binding GntR family transcriptional regulator|nr:MULTISPECIES: GntR family transcriptional regulator [unclassified Aminobacterium]MDD2205985.1 GntR family transcriptional regulator [Aminobacterium sp.]MDD3426956.1 GntR family transcriptional regulator [Aminobacterium sp.]MDD3707162.1 GntR family transcriptional regulator [Aminobacterium sp.]MDD4227858.1 GntR family transcriptional regulator [Aminobacterium sp.]MDD4550702.1 GntR family transcriptional regulator [Aminobacterium sp.]
MVRMKKKDIAYEEIKKLILDKEYMKSYDISENSLAEKLNMSRTPIREALQRLQMEGFIEIFPNRGIVLRDVTLLEANEIFDLRMAIEEFVIKNVFPLLTDEHFKEIDRNLSYQKLAMEKDDVAEYLNYDRDFHDYFLHVYSNSLIISTSKRVQDRFFSVGVNVLKGPGTVERSFRQHCDIVDALRKNDPVMAAEAMHLHMLTGKKNLMS